MHPYRRFDACFAGQGDAALDVHVSNDTVRMHGQRFAAAGSAAGGTMVTGHPREATR